ncbi:hypothetical protein ACUXCC_001631 [Cytobacillus horneckiae]|uniref:Uncharacterized protein n=1 Tax=Cytobacillus horneckiae TaxID=549687 RepID=A0A2N0ZL31_9BACI|nr:hypothetical protein [Cytobacillus horneckiae]MBN6885609.1 hypothetical protein [Cytobacillus horneckiae]MEC1156280.1 hypothetical protein [Cytobacillus horneckiae]MED2938298.1 hypothetical protein [Cytobacillus horneckiae]PKG30186.1 hypothetical protein CWS20_04115 [Cytobacillus horneckiae]
MNKYRLAFTVRGYDLFSAVKAKEKGTSSPTEFIKQIPDEKGVYIMKKQEKQNQSVNKERQEELQTINDITNMENGQPVPTPKDYDEIEY